MIDPTIRLISWNRWANLKVFAPLQASGGAPESALAAFQHVLETELMWLRWMSGDAEAWVEPWQPPTLERCRDYLNQTDAMMATLGETLEAQFDATFEYLTPWAGRQQARISDAVLHVLMHSSQYRGEASGFLNAEGHTVPDIDFMRYLTVPQDE